ncbi:hypothetical protein MRX96_006597 [Rhipicephalus microplus]
MDTGSSIPGLEAMSLVAAKDSRWLQLEVCREYQRNKCSRQDAECKFAHPPPNVEVQNGRVIACYDSIKGRCNREKPPCKYFHPPQHLKDQLLINGRNHLALKNALLQQMPLQAMLPGQLPTAAVAASPYMPALTTMATASSFGHYLTPSPVLPGMMTADAVTAPLSVVPASLVSPQKVARTDRLEVCREFQRGTCKRPETECRFGHPPEHVAVDSGDGAVTVCMDFVKGRCSRDQCRYFHPPPHLQAQLKATQSRAGAAAAAAAAAMKVCTRRRVGHSGTGLPWGLALLAVLCYVLGGPSGTKQTNPVCHTRRQREEAPMSDYKCTLSRAWEILPRARSVPESLQMKLSWHCPVLYLTQNALPSIRAVCLCTSPVPQHTSRPWLYRCNSPSCLSRLLDTLPVCRDFKSGQCKRPQCRYVHLVEEFVEVVEGKVTVCRDAAKGRCARPLCKYYHVPALSLSPL